TPPEAILILRGLALACAMNSGTVFAGNDGIHRHDVGHAEEASNWRNVANEVEIEIVIERRVDRVCGITHEKRIAVWRCPHDCFGGYIASGPWPVLDDELLAESLRQPLRHRTPDRLGLTAGSKTDNPA